MGGADRSLVPPPHWHSLLDRVREDKARGNPPVQLLLGAKTADREYRLWLARNISAGYSSYFEWQP